MLKAETAGAVDPATGWLISPIVALKAASSDFTKLRAYAMRFRGIYRGSDIGKLDVWLDDAQASGNYAIVRFVLTLRQDIAAVRNAITEIWRNGQVKGRIKRLKTLKRALYGRENVELLRARMMPLNS